MHFLKAKDPMEVLEEEVEKQVLKGPRTSICIKSTGMHTVIGQNCWSIWYDVYRKGELYGRGYEALYFLYGTA